MSRPEIYVSIDIESDGPAPGLYSMLALGAAAFSGETDEVVSTWYATLLPLPAAGQHPDTMAWWQTQPDAWAEVHRGQRQPNLAIPEFARWCTELSGPVSEDGLRNHVAVDDAIGQGRLFMALRRKALDRAANIR